MPLARVIHYIGWKEVMQNTREAAAMIDHLQGRSPENQARNLDCVWLLLKLAVVVWAVLMVTWLVA